MGPAPIEENVEPRQVWWRVAALLAIALAIRIVVFGLVTAFGPDGMRGEVVSHVKLIADPTDYLLHPSRAVGEYAPFLGFFEWLTASPWSAMGVGDLSALRLGSIVWDLAGMAVLLVAVARRFPDRIVFVGLLWAAAPLLWPASANGAQDETIAACLVSIVILLLFVDRWIEAVVVATLTLFAAELLLAPLLLALVVTAPRQLRGRVVGAAVATLVGAVAVVWMLTGSDGVSQQTGYRFELSGGSASLRHLFPAEPATRVSLIVMLVPLVVALVLWSRHRVPGILEPVRLGAALLVACLAVSMLSDPEYLCLVAPLAYVGCLQARRPIQPWLIVAMASLAWLIHGAFGRGWFAFIPDAVLLGEGFVRRMGDRIGDGVVVPVLVVYALAAVGLAWTYLVSAGRSRRRQDADRPSRI